MDLPLGAHRDDFVREQVRSDRFAMPGDMIREGLRLVEERQTGLDAPRAKVEASVARDGAYSGEEVGARIAATVARLRRSEM